MSIYGNHQEHFLDWDFTPILDWSNNLRRNSSEFQGKSLIINPAAYAA
jgi:hypothetical protein